MQISIYERACSFEFKCHMICVRGRACVLSLSLRRERARSLSPFSLLSLARALSLSFSLSLSLLPPSLILTLTMHMRIHRTSVAAVKASMGSPVKRSSSLT